MNVAVLGWEDVAFRLDHRRFAYAGKFVVPGGKAVVYEPGAAVESLPDPHDDYARGILAAAAFSADRTDPTVLWLRYFTVRSDRHGEGIGPRLAAVVADRAASEGFERARIAVNNPFAYDAVYKAGFTYTGTTTGIAELVCARPTGPIDASRIEGRENAGHDHDRGRDRSAATYHAGLDAYRERDLPPVERAFCERASERGPPPILDAPA